MVTFSVSASSVSWYHHPRFTRCGISNCRTLGPPALPQLPGSPAWLTFHSLAICPNDIPAEPPASPPPRTASRRIHPSEPGPGSTRRNFPQFLLRCWPGVSGLLRFLVLTPHSLCQEAITVCVRCPRSYFAAYPFFRTVSETWDFFFFFTSRIDQDNTIQDHAWLSEHGLSVIAWAWLRVERQWPLTAVSLLHFPANRLSPRLGGPAVPDVLAAHLHPGAPPAPAGLLLVSWPCRLPWAQTRTGRRRLICRWSKLRGLTHVCVWMRPLKPDMEISNKC